ncbi:MAG: PHP domain-containing protein, partial [Clostridia bacterium]|nr:PHP domain-containing protein [Clostridia bacterium]
MSKQVTLMNMFPDYAPPEALEKVLSQAAIVAADIDPKTRVVQMVIHSETYISNRGLEQLQKEIATVYGLKKLIISATFPPEQLIKIEPEDIRELFIAKNSMSRGSLAGARWQWEDQTLHIYLKGNGKESLQEVVPAVTRQLQEQFATSVSIELHSGETLEGQALFDAMEQMRGNILTTLPQTPVFQKKETVAENNPAFYGKAFKGKVTPMKELNLDMGSVIVEGRVFGVEHKELKKRNAWVINFSMTDNHGSVQINRFMENNEAKPILENVKVGSVLKVQGRLQINQFDNEMVLRPVAMMPGVMEKRKDTAAGDKRVELHLHTIMSNMDALTNTKDAIKQAAAWGHRAIAITDHGCCQSFTDALHTVEDWKGA